MSTFTVVFVMLCMALFLIWKHSTTLNILIKWSLLGLVLAGCAALTGYLPIGDFARFAMGFTLGLAIIWDKSDGMNLFVKIALGLMSVWGFLVSFSVL